MRYIKEYSEYEGGIGVEDIEDCFRDLIDMGIRVNISTPEAGRLQLSAGTFLRSAGFYPFDTVFAVSVTLNELATEEAVSEYGERYNAVRDGQMIAELLAEAIAKCEGVLDLEAFRADIKWANAGELPYYRKMKLKSEQGLTDAEADSIFRIIGPGPEILSRLFDQKCKTTLKDSAWLCCKLNTSELDESIQEKGDRLRNLSVCLGKRKAKRKKRT